jgi:hypothetical protein
MNEAFDAPFIWTKSQIESPAYLKLREAVMSDLGGVLVFSCPCLAGKSWALKDLIYIMLRDTHMPYPVRIGRTLFVFKRGAR